MFGDLLGQLEQLGQQAQNYVTEVVGNQGSNFIANLFGQGTAPAVPPPMTPAPVAPTPAPAPMLAQSSLMAKLKTPLIIGLGALALVVVFAKKKRRG